MIKIDSEETFGSGQGTGTKFTFQLEITGKKPKKQKNPNTVQETMTLKTLDINQGRTVIPERWEKMK